MAVKRRAGGWWVFRRRVESQGRGTFLTTESTDFHGRGAFLAEITAFV